ncbi:hypothetical protein F4813DRAFT_375895 [Daldinia decipiens]|uniref:uncharacterized protein n=1 Tax=Daldinia decipiens TaxID=326647 RepID=UPI0020C36CAE|nr:uncharacterized protein F4813DRAFT_375895 [Daldinia decipiens]KAI1653124.1 hypothetical protein F4813DRAFT_375895 [Daldinia decipiens]
MERKRKLPARAAARVEHVSKKRTATPPERSVTPVPASASTPVPTETVTEDPPLPKSIQAGNPLPTVEHPQPDDLLSKDYQSIQESGVLAESLLRSRQKWAHEGVFEKYWTKPTKRKGVVKEDPNNPPKDSMTKIGQVTITVEPHVLEATMYAVKDPKPAPTTNSTFRPIVQYGPPNGAMPPPPKPSTPSTPSAPITSPSQPPAQPPSQPPSTAPPPVQAQGQTQPQSQTQQLDLQRPPPTTIPPNKPLASPRGLDSVLAAPQHPPTIPPTTGPSQPAPPQPRGPSQPGLSTNRPLHAPNSGATAAVTGPAVPAPPKSSTPAAKPATPTAPGADPIIVTLAERASEDPQLRDLMKRVAIGDAAPAELAHFQKIIDQITADYKKKGGQHGPSADRLIVDGRTVKYFADEVRTILEIVLASNPHQRSNDLRTPPGSDPLVILLVKKALDDVATRDIVRRIAEGKTKFTDTTDLKTTLDKLKDLVVKETSKPQQVTTGASQTTTTNGVESPTVQTSSVPRKASLTGPGQPTHASSSQQALRSKGPPPSIKPDISAIVLEFSGGNGDRYLFPKYSIIEYVNPTQAVASFLIVRKGSKLEYGGDPALDYYQPVTIRIYAQSPKHLESLARVVAPQDEVRRYMDDIMDNMTRAEYVLLAMRLPKADKEEQVEEGTSTPKVDPANQPQQSKVLWSSKVSSTATPPQKPITKPLGEDEQYQSFIATVS